MPQMCDAIQQQDTKARNCTVVASKFEQSREMESAAAYRIYGVPSTAWNAVQLSTLQASTKSCESDVTMIYRNSCCTKLLAL